MYPEWFSETEEDIKQRMLANIPPNRDKREGGFIFDLIAAFSKERTLGRKENKELLDLNFVDTATEDALDRAIMSRSPLSRGEVTFATGFVQVIGIPGTKIPAGTIYMSIMPDDETGLLEFEQINEAVLDSSGTAVVKVEALIGGQVGNIPPGTVELAEPIPGIADVDNLEWFSGGIDEEDDDSFRDRYYLWIQSEANGGNIDSYVKWAIEVAGVGGVQVIPLWNGRGTVKVILIDTDGKPAGVDLVQQVQKKIASIPEEGEDDAPIGATVTVTSAESVLINVSATLVLDGTRSISEIVASFSLKLSELLQKIAKENWKRRAQSYYISATRISALIWDIEGVRDCLDFSINGGTGTIEIEAGKVAEKGTVTFNE